MALSLTIYKGLYIIILLGKEKEKKLGVYDFITDRGSHLINKRQYVLKQYIPLTY